jgi:hypothetical protein
MRNAASRHDKKISAQFFRTAATTDREAIRQASVVFYSSIIASKSISSEKPFNLFGKIVSWFPDHALAAAANALQLAV